MNLVSGKRLNFCPKCKTAGHLLEKRRTSYHCKCGLDIPYPPVNKVPVKQRWTLEYDVRKSNWYYLDEFGTKCWVN